MGYKDMVLALGTGGGTACCTCDDKHLFCDVKLAESLLPNTFGLFIWNLGIGCIPV